VTLSPASGSFLIAGIDNVLIMAQPASAVPEPRTLVLLGPVLIVGALLLALISASHLHKLTERSLEL
jgi:hypothetical protein